MLLRHVGNILFFNIYGIFLNYQHSPLRWAWYMIWILIALFLNYQHSPLFLWCCVGLTNLGKTFWFPCHMFDFSVLHCVVMHNCCWHQPKPIHMHWKIHSRLIPSSRPHEDDSRVDLGVPFLWQRGPQFPCRPWHASGCHRHDLVWERVVETWRERAPGLLNTKWENSEARDTVLAVWAWSESLKWEQQSHPVLLDSTEQKSCASWALISLIYSFYTF